MSNQKIETIINTLAGGYKQLVKGTLQEAAEVQTQRRTDSDLRKQFIYTANLPLFRIRDGQLEYGLSGRPTFDGIAGEDIDTFTGQILQNGVYRLSGPQVKGLDNFTGDIVWVKTTDLGLVKKNEEWSYFPIDTSDFTASSLNDARRPLVVKVQGSLTAKSDPQQELSDYGENMRMLQIAGINQTKQWWPTPSYIREFIKSEGVVGQASRLCRFGDNSNFITYDRNVNDHGALRGVPFEEARSAVAPREEVPKTSPEEQKVIVALTMEDILAISRPYVPQACWGQWQEDLRKRVKQ